MRNASRITLGVIAVVTALVLTACGSGDDEPATNNNSKAANTDVGDGHKHHIGDMVEAGEGGGDSTLTVAGLHKLTPTGEKITNVEQGVDYYEFNAAFDLDLPEPILVSGLDFQLVDTDGNAYTNTTYTPVSTESFTDTQFPEFEQREAETGKVAGGIIVGVPSDTEVEKVVFSRTEFYVN